MRARIDWLVPLSFVALVGFGVAAAGNALGWSRGVVFAGMLIVGTIGILLRFHMHDYDADLERERAERARTLLPYIEAELRKRERGSS